MSASEQKIDSVVHGMNKPRIGITTYLQPARWGAWDEPAALLSATYVECIVAAGGVPLMLPPVGTDTSIVKDLDGLIIAGGSDIGPERYGAKPHPRTAAESHRDDHDFALASAALQHRLPLFAICRGLQVINVLQGGTLIQHLPEIVKNTDYRPAPGVFGRINVRTEPDTKVAKFLGSHAEVSSHHHQAVDKVGNGLRITAQSDDGVVQGLEFEPSFTIDAAQAADTHHSAHGWMMAVQWHPERTIEDLRLFEGFLTAAHTYRQDRIGTTGEERNSAR